MQFVFCVRLAKNGAAFPQSLPSHLFPTDAVFFVTKSKIKTTTVTSDQWPLAGRNCDSDSDWVKAKDQEGTDMGF